MQFEERVAPRRLYVSDESTMKCAQIAPSLRVATKTRACVVTSLAKSLVLASPRS